MSERDHDAPDAPNTLGKLINAPIAVAALPVIVVTILPWLYGDLILGDWEADYQKRLVLLELEERAESARSVEPSTTFIELGSNKLFSQFKGHGFRELVLMLASHNESYSDELIAYATKPRDAANEWLPSFAALIEEIAVQEGLTDQGETKYAVDMSAWLWVLTVLITVQSLAILVLLKFVFCDPAAREMRRLTKRFADADEADRPKKRARKKG